MPGDEISRIEDATVRRFVRTLVHVRRFLPFYATGTLFALTMALVPTVGGNGGGDGVPASVAGPGGGAAGTATGAARSTGGGGGTPVSSRATGPSASLVGATTYGADDASTDDPDGSPAPLGAGVTTPAATRADVRSGDGASGPDFGATDGLPDTPDAPEPCRLQLPPPAPEVDPARELSGGQDTAEAVLGQDLPADGGETIAPVAQPALCGIPDAPAGAPPVSLPATPLAVDGAEPGGLPLAWLLRFAALV